MLVLEGPRGLHVAGPAEIVAVDAVRAWQGADSPAPKRDDIAYMVGRFIETGSANTNGHIFNIDEVKTNISSIVHAPFNMAHRTQYVLGHYTAYRLREPDDMPKAMHTTDPEHPWVETTNAFFRRAFPQEYRAIEAAHMMGAFFQSMECVPDALTCGDPSCGQTFEFQGITHDTYCAHLNASPRSKKYLRNPHFVGGGAIIPPVKPGWKKAEMHNIAAVIEAHSKSAELAYAGLKAEAGHLDDQVIADLMGLLLLGMFGPVPEPKVKTATQLRAAGQIAKVLVGYTEEPISGHGTCGDCIHSVFATADGLGVCKLVEGPISAGATCLLHDPAPVDVHIEPPRAWPKWDAAEMPTPKAAGLAIVAADTGRVLLLQRALDETDPASGKWEFPGGKIDDGEGAYEAALREFGEEVGIMPPGRLVGDWLSPNGVYHGFIRLVSTESDVPVNLEPDNRHVLNPDDPDQDNIEVVAWWTVADAEANPVLRDEMATTPWADISAAAAGRLAN